MNFAEFRKRRQSIANIQSQAKERRPSMTTQEERFLYSLRLKTMEYRTLMSTLRQSLPNLQLDEIIVEYNLRLRKAKSNFIKQNYKYEWEEDNEIL